MWRPQFGKPLSVIFRPWPLAPTPAIIEIQLDELLDHIAPCRIVDRRKEILDTRRLATLPGSLEGLDRRIVTEPA